MPEIKKGCLGGRMEKDLDERLVPNGLYRHAMNVEVKTTTSESDGEGDSGTVQNIRGNESIGSIIHPPEQDTDSIKCIASVADEKNDKAYFFFTSGELLDYAGGSGGITYPDGDVAFIDNIVELDTTTGITSAIVTDVWLRVSTWDVAMGSNPTIPSTTEPWNQITLATGKGANYRPGMEFSLSVPGSNNATPGAIIKSVDGETITLSD